MPRILFVPRELDKLNGSLHWYPAPTAALTAANPDSGMTDPRNVLQPPPPEDDTISLYALFRVLLQYRYLVVGATLLMGFVAAGSALMRARSYTAHAAFMPQGGPGSASTGAIAALAGRFGVSVPQVEPAQSPQFYAELLESRELLGRLLPDTFSVAFDPRTGAEAARGTLADFLQIEEEVVPLRREKTLRAVSTAISTSTTRETGIVHVQVTTPWAELSEAVAWRLIELVNEFNLKTRQTNAAAESRFIEERLTETGASLRHAEEELRTFLEANRQFQDSPQLLFEHDRLQRRVLHQQQLYTELQQSLERARITEVRDTPVITVVESPERPVYPDSRRVALWALLGLLGGGMVAVFFSFLREFLWNAPEGEDPEYERLQHVWRETLADLTVGRRRPTAAPASSARAKG